MTWFTISYDTHKDRDYQSLYDAMEKIDAIRALESVWMINVSNTYTEVREWLRGLLDDNDTIFVIQMNPRHAWAARHLKPEVVEWIKRLNVS